MVDHIASKISDDYKKIVIDAVVRPQGFKAKLKGLMLLIAKFMKKIADVVVNPDTWKKKKSWIFALVFLRCAYVLMNEYGMNPFKKSLKGDHVFLTGAGSGIGQGMAIKFGKLGCKLSLSDINMDGLKLTQDLCVKAGISVDQICIFVCDVSSGNSIKEGAAKARAAFGEVTILINNAGIVSGKNTSELSDAMIDRTLQVNTISHLHTIKEFLPGMIAKKRGHIVSIASMAGHCGLPGLSDYCASKYGAVAIDECVRLELIKEGHSGYIKTTCICPYFISTGMFQGAKSVFPMYILSPQEVVDRIIAGVQQEEPMVIVPWRGNIIFLVRLLPISVQDMVGRALGMHNQMSDFEGKGDMEKRIPGLQTHKVR